MLVGYVLQQPHDFLPEVLFQLVCGRRQSAISGLPFSDFFYLSSGTSIIKINTHLKSAGVYFKLFGWCKYQVYIFTPGDTTACWSSQQSFGCVRHFKPSLTTALGFQAAIQHTLITSLSPFELRLALLWDSSFQGSVLLSSHPLLSLDCLVHVFSAYACTDGLAIRFILSPRCSLTADLAKGLLDI